jgi:hypothetical protein
MHKYVFSVRYLGLDARIIKQCILKSVWNGMDLIQLAQDRDKYSGYCERGNKLSGSVIFGIFFLIRSGTVRFPRTVFSGGRYLVLLKIRSVINTLPKIFVKT